MIHLMPWWAILLAASLLCLVPTTVIVVTAVIGAGRYDAARGMDDEQAWPGAGDAG